MHFFCACDALFFLLFRFLLFCSVCDRVLCLQVRPLFEEHGDVLEVALIKDRKTGEQQGVLRLCFSCSTITIEYLFCFQVSERL
jgi:hypothetical protein